MAVGGRLKLKLEAVLEVRISGKGKSEVGWVEGGVVLTGILDGMVTEVAGVRVTECLEHLG